MAGDSRVTQGTHVSKLSESTSKIWQEEEGMIIGGVGTLHELQLMRYGHLIDPDDILLGRVDVEYLYWLYSKYGDLYLKRYGATLDGNTGYMNMLSSTFMFAVDGHLYTLDSWGSVLEHDTFEAIGCADDLVRGYLMGHEDEEDVPKLLADAIKAAAKVDSGIDDNISIYVLDFDEELQNSENSAG